MLTLLLVISLVAVACASACATLLYVRSKQSGSKPTPEQAPPSGEISLQSQTRNQRGEILRLTQNAGAAVIDFRNLAKKDVKGTDWTSLSLSEESLISLNPLVAQATEFLKAPFLQMSKGRTFEVIFSGHGDLMKAKGGEGFRAMLTDSRSHQITSQGLLLKPSSTLNPLIAWECAAALVGRKYLADIAKDLRAISKTVQNLEIKSEIERLSELQEDSRTIELILDRVQARPDYLFRNPSLQNQIHTIERNAAKVARSCATQLKMEHATLENLKDLTGLRNAPTDPLLSAARKITHLLQTAKFALQLRINCGILMDGFLEDNLARENSIEGVSELLESLRSGQETSSDLLYRKVKELDEIFRFEENVQRMRSKARFQLDSILKKFSGFGSVRDAVAHASTKNMASHLGSKVKMLIETDKDGKIIKTLVGT